MNEFKTGEKVGDEKVSDCTEEGEGEGCRAAGCTVTQGEEYGLVLADTPPASNKQLMQLSMHHPTPPSASHVATLNTLNQITMLKGTISMIIKILIN